MYIEYIISNHNLNKIWGVFCLFFKYLCNGNTKKKHWCKTLWKCTDIYPGICKVIISTLNIKEQSKTRCWIGYFCTKLHWFVVCFYGFVTFFMWQSCLIKNFFTQPWWSRTSSLVLSFGPSLQQRNWGAEVHPEKGEGAGEGPRDCHIRSSCGSWAYLA